MAISKRTRFEVLRRDNHTCQYCGGKAPDVILHVDHIIPVALGGDDSPGNLVTACKDCNAGKTSISPDSPIVAAIALRSAEYALTNLNRAARIESEMLEMERYEEDFLVSWNRWSTGTGTSAAKLPLPSDWRNSLKTWWKVKVPFSLIDSAIETAMGAPEVEPDATFRYFAGVIWRTLDEFDMRYPHQTNEGRVYTEEQVIDERIQAYEQGYRAGIEIEKERDTDG